MGNLKYVVPNGITAASMAVGMMSVAASVGGRYVDAAWFIMLCVLLDKADGTAARLLKASSSFGVQLDSFSDFLTFGMAPAFLCFSLMTQDPRYMGFYSDGTMYWIARVVPGFFVICAGFRLAKFNVLTESIGSKIFLGVPTTLCGAFIASFMLTAWKFDFADTTIGYFPLALFGLGAWMVSNLPLPKLQKTSSMAYNMFIVANVVIAYTLGVIRMLPEVLFIQAAVYLVVGTVFASMKMDVPNPRAEAA